MTRIKICGLSRVEEALAAVHSGADALGLVFYAPSPRYVTLATARRLTDALPPFVSVVGLFVDAELSFVREVLAEVPLDLLQFHGAEQADYCAQFSMPYLKAIRVRSGVDLLQCAQQFPQARGLLLDAYQEGVPGGTGARFDWKLIPAQLPLPVILSGGLDASNVAAAISQVAPYAVDVSSGVESGRGIKDAAKIVEFINEVKRTDVQLSR